VELGGKQRSAAAWGGATTKLGRGNDEAWLGRSLAKRGRHLCGVGGQWCSSDGCRHGRSRRRVGPICASTRQIRAIGVEPSHHVEVSQSGSRLSWVVLVLTEVVSDSFHVQVGGGRGTTSLSHVRCQSNTALLTATARRCGDGGLRLHGLFCLDSKSVGDVRLCGRKSCLTGPGATAPAGVVPLLRGVYKVCQHLPRSLGVSCFLRAKSSIGSSIGATAACLTSYLCRKHCS
jgi:hypothetical protein